MDRELLSIDDMIAFDSFRYGVCKAAERLIKLHKLDAFWQFYNQNNTAKGLAYHNHIHTCWMMSEVSALAVDCFLDTDDTRKLILAAMFHDFCHSGGLTDDADNVTRAIEGFKKAMICSVNDGLSAADCREVAELIRVTQFPFIHAPTTLSQQIIRDADVLYGVGQRFKKVIYVDLYSELLVSKPDMSFASFVEGQKLFLQSVEMFTGIGQRRLSSFIENRAKPFWENCQPL